MRTYALDESTISGSLGVRRHYAVEGEVLSAEALKAQSHDHFWKKTRLGWRKRERNGDGSAHAQSLQELLQRPLAKLTE